MSIDPRETSKRFVAQLREKQSGDLDFPFLQDRGHKVIDRYGILNPEGKGWPYPATYVIDRQGKVRWKFVEIDYRLRPTNDQVLAVLRTIR